MLIDWFTTGAQLVNFLILVWLMKRFLYAPVLAAIAARETLIASQLSDAAARQAAAEQAGADFKQKIADFDRQHAQMMSDALAQAESEKKRLIAVGQAASDAARKAQQAALENARQRLCNQVTLQVRDEAFALARHTLAQLADSSLEDNMVRLFARRVADLGQDERSHLAAALAAAPSAAVVRSAMPLGEPLRLAVKEALQAGGLICESLQFETAAQLVSGIEFSINGWKLDWNVDACLQSIKQRAGMLLAGAAAEAISPVQATPSDLRAFVPMVSPPSVVGVEPAVAAPVDTSPSALPSAPAVTTP